MATNTHIPVLLNETIDLLNIKSNGVYLDCTSGRGGHSEAILNKLSSKGRLICLDIDDDAIKFLKAKFKNKTNVEVHKCNFKDIVELLNSLNLNGVDGVIADIGVSSPMFDNVERGFSYHNNANLDMRMDQTQKITAQYVINNYTLGQLINVFKTYGEAHDAICVSKKITQTRKDHPIITTNELVEIIKSSISKKNLSLIKHPAKQYFQALRIEVNDELNNLERLINSLPLILKKNGVCAIISFHSLEDRIVKDGFIKLTNNNLPKEIPIIAKPLFSLLNKKPITASISELDSNKRARSAKLRGIIKNV
ncbi:MAG: 16S rRNA (cytosine(1402)-N(4))-methyltransferase RsmH [Mycoplasmataceae bacterium]|jgi:16S rRNA (cytosine1402-N4)-methyltransferase|nr:16S rRNA (cytosine(1402)-N(4))-methyltransferase RsmH [Mycoplasmataceae bacterium]